MKKCILFFAAIWMTLCFCSCDDGRIYEKEIEVQRGGRVLKLTGRFSGISNWTDDYSVVVAGFNDKSEYAVITKSLPVKSLKLCVISRLRECIVEFKTMEDEELAAITDTILMDVGTLDVGMFSSIQSQVFDKRCVACHGQTGSASGNLFLTEGKSYHALVNQPAHKNSDILLVKPGSAEESFLHLVLNRAGDTSMNHTDMLSEDEQPLLKLIDNWINEGIFLNNE